MTIAWLVGWIAPLLMAGAAFTATVTRHRWRFALWVGTVVGVGFCALAWLILRAALRDADRSMEIVFLQLALSTGGVFGFSVAAMLARKWQTK